MNSRFSPIWVQGNLKVFLLSILIVIGAVRLAEATEEKPVIPSLKESIQTALKHMKGGQSANETTFRVKKSYYEIQYQTEQLEISREVQGHFEKAVEKSQEKFDAGDEDISQSDITKLKLGLADTLNDGIELESGIRLARLTLGNLMGMDFHADSELADKEIKPVAFPYETIEDYYGKRCRCVPGNSADTSGGAKSKVKNEGFLGLSSEQSFPIKTAFIKVREKKEKLELAKRMRKITRALLVAEVANYDFGIGDAGDLFEALIIYTKVLQGYYSSINSFNLAVAEFERAYSEQLS